MKGIEVSLLDSELIKPCGTEEETFAFALAFAAKAVGKVECDALTELDGLDALPGAEAA